MSNKRYVEIVLDKPRKLCFDMNAMAGFEDATGKSFFEWSQNMSKMTAKDLRAFLWSCLVHEDEKLTIQMVGSFINRENMESIQESLVKVQLANAAETEAGKEGEKVPLAESPQG